MPEPNPIYQISDADVFSRGSLKLTYDLLRKKNPALALAVRNIINCEALPRVDEDNDSPNSDHFRVPLDSFQVRAVVEGLMEYDQAITGQSEQAGLAIMAKTLMEDWIALAHKMVNELPADQKPF